MKFVRFVNTALICLLVIFLWGTAPACNFLSWPYLWRLAAYIAIIWYGATRSFTKLPSDLLSLIRNAYRILRWTIVTFRRKLFRDLIMQTLLEIDLDEIDNLANQSLKYVRHNRTISEKTKIIQEAWRSYHRYLALALFINVFTIILIGDNAVYQESFISIVALTAWVIISVETITAPVLSIRFARLDTCANYCIPTLVGLNYGACLVYLFVGIINRSVTSEAAMLPWQVAVCQLQLRSFTLTLSAGHVAIIISISLTLICLGAACLRINKLEKIRSLITTQSI